MNRKQIVKLNWPNKVIIGYDEANDLITWNTLDTTPNPTNDELDAAIAAYYETHSYVITAAVGVPSGAASLDMTGKVPLNQLPTSALGGVPGGTDGQVQFNSAGAFSGASGVIVDSNGCLQLLQSSTPATPATDRCSLLSINQAGRILPSWMDNTGGIKSIQAGLSSSRVGRWTPVGNTTTVNADGLIAPSLSGTTTARAVAITNKFTSMRRVGLVSGVGSGASVAAVLPALQFWRGNAAGLGGFYAVFRFGVSDAAAVANPRMFVGMYSSASAIGSVQPTSLLNIFGVGCDQGEAVLKLIYNDGTGTASSLSLGSNFPTNTLSTDPYELILYCPPFEAFINYEVTNLRTGINTSGSISTNIPVNTQLLSPQFWRNNGSTNLAVGLDVISLYVETDF